MKTLTFAAAVGIALLTHAPTGLASVVFVPPWLANPTDPQWQDGEKTSQGWEFGADPASAVIDGNPFGLPGIQFTDASPSSVTDFPGSTAPIQTWHVDRDGGGFTLLIPNNPSPRDRKVIHLQYTSDKASLGPPVTSPAGMATAGGVAGLGPGSSWYTYEWLIEIRPNPNFETIWVPFPESTDIEEIWVHTICVPEPEAWAVSTALGLGILTGMRVWGRRSGR